MATPLSIPFSQRLPQTPNFGAVRGAMQRTAAADRRLGATIGRVAERIGNEVEEWQARRDSEALARAGAELDSFSVEEAARVQSATDLDFDRAPDLYAEALNQKRAEIAAQHNPRVQKEFNLRSDLAIQRKSGVLKANLITREAEFREQEVYRNTAKFAREGLDLAALQQYMRAGLQWVPKEKQEDYIEFGKEALFDGLIDRSPEMAVSLLEQGKDTFSQPGTWNTLYRRARSVIAARNIQEERERKLQVEQAERQVTLQVFQTVGGRAAAGQEVTPATLDQLLNSGAIETTAYKGLMGLLLQEKPADVQQQDEAYRAVSEAYYRYKAHEISLKDVKDVFYARAADLQVEDRESWWDKIQSQGYDNQAAVRKFAEDQARDHFKDLFTVGTGADRKTNTNRLEWATNRAVRLFGQWLSAWPKERPFNENEAKEKALSLIQDQRTIYKNLAGGKEDFAEVLSGQDLKDRLGFLFKPGAPDDKPVEEAKPKTVRMKSPKGQWKEFSSDQADEALKHGWTQQ